jgi:hypothetical protein
MPGHEESGCGGAEDERTGSSVPTGRVSALVHGHMSPAVFLSRTKWGASRPRGTIAMAHRQIGRRSGDVVAQLPECSYPVVDDVPRPSGPAAGPRKEPAWQ